MRKHRVLALGVAMLVALAACTGGGGSKEAIRIGSDNFYESKLMAEIYAQVLENDGYEVTRNFGLGSRQERAPAFEAGQVDLVPEYVGSGLGFYDITQVTGDGETNRERLQVVFDTKGPDGGKLASVLAITHGEDTNAAVVRADTASSLGLAKMSDLAAIQGDLTWGLPPDCDENPLCRGALEQYWITYPPAQRESLAACDAPIAEALNGNAIDFAWLCSTQPAISTFGFVVLEDDLDTQPAENIAPLVLESYLEKVDRDAFAALLDAASAFMTTEELTLLGVKVAVENQDVGDVAVEWLPAKGLLGGS